MKKIVLVGLYISVVLSLFAQTEREVAAASQPQKPVYTAEQQRLRITAKDIRLVPETKLETKGYHLYVRKRPEIESILLTETTKDPEGKSDSFAYRARQYNSVNGDELRYLDGKPLISEWSKYSLVDSSAEPDPVFGEAFHIYIPEVLDYGYEWERHGSVTIGKGTFINVRTFEKKYADYSGAFMDSPFMFDLQTRKKVVKKPVVKNPEPKPVVKNDPPEELPPVEEPVFEEPEEEKEEVILTDEYNPRANDSFKEIAEDLIYSKGPETITEDIFKCLEKIDPNQPLDLVFVIDATGSMKNDIDTLKSELVPALIERMSGFELIRYGLLFYRDYADNFRYKELPVKFSDFTYDLEEFNKNLNALVIKGKEGGDVPEAVYEALYAAVNFYTYRENAYRKVILIGDAEPHPTPRGSRRYSKDFVSKEIKKTGAHVDAILLPED